MADLYVLAASSKSHTGTSSAAKSPSETGSVTGIYVHMIKCTPMRQNKADVSVQLQTDTGSTQIVLADDESGEIIGQVETKGTGVATADVGDAVAFDSVDIVGESYENTQTTHEEGDLYRVVDRQVIYTDVSAEVGDNSTEFLAQRITYFVVPAEEYSES